MTLKRVLGAGDAAWIVAGNMIGAGIFITPGIVAGLAPGRVLPLLAWLLGGLLSWCGAVVYAELGARLPRAGGDYQYLRVAFGPLWGFLNGWAALTMTFSGAAAVMAIVTVENLGTAWPALALQPWLGRVLAPLLVLLLTGANVAGARIAGRTTAALTALPVAGLAILFAIGVLAGRDGPAAAAAAPAPAGRALLGFGAAMLPVFFTYSGWNAAAYVAGEIRDPERNLARGLVVGTLLVAVFYVLFNLLLLVVLPPEVLAGSTTAGAQAARRLLGEPAERVLAVLVAAAVLGSANVTLMAGARIYYAMALDGLAPAVLARTNAAGVPAAAVFAGGLWTALLATTGRVEDLVDWATLAILLLSALAMGSLFVLRRGDGAAAVIASAAPRAEELVAPARQSAYRCPGYPWTPLLYFMASLGVAVASAVRDWRQAVYGVLIVAAGVPAYGLVCRTFRARPPGRS